jgi:hypothetical protein
MPAQGRWLDRQKVDEQERIFLLMMYLEPAITDHLANVFKETVDSFRQARQCG